MGRGASCGVRTSRRTRSTGQPQGYRHPRLTIAEPDLADEDGKPFSWSTSRRSVPRDAKEIHGEISDPEWVESESDSVTLVWEIDEDHRYTLTELEG